MQGTEGINKTVDATKSILAQKEEELRMLEQKERELIETERMIDSQKEAEEK